QFHVPGLGRQQHPMAELALRLFFFQAEDGIRDRNVTGVQTCALPISEPAACAAPFLCCFLASIAARVRLPYFCSISRNRGRTERSEERRVGKECRSRWSPYRSKKKAYLKAGTLTVW